MHCNTDLLNVGLTQAHPNDCNSIHNFIQKLVGSQGNLMSQAKDYSIQIQVDITPNVMALILKW